MVRFRSSHLVLIVLTVASACSEQRTANLVEPQFAKPTTGVTVKSTIPSWGARGTTINVRVLGSGFAPGFRAIWALAGDTTFAVTRIRTNSTTYVSSTELNASITIETDADVSLYDVVAVGNGKKGIGIELFEVTYVFYDLGEIDAIPLRLNNRSQVVFSSGSQALVWEGGVVRALPLLPGTSACRAWDINDAGTVVGECSTHAVIWPTGGMPQELGGEVARAINNNGDVVGISNGRAVAWMGGTRIDVGASIELWDINDSGIAVGQNYSATNRASIVWSQTTGIQSIYPDGTSLGISSDGVVVGWAKPPGGTIEIGFRWFAGTLQWLGTLSGGDHSMAQMANSLGQIVGRSSTALRGNRVTCCSGFVWTAAAGMKKLEVPTGWSIIWASDINEQGLIVGLAVSGGVNRGVLWEPSP